MAALAGNYVNFGVFELYGDRALADALDIALKMTLSVPLADILAYRKVQLNLFKVLTSGPRKNITLSREKIRRIHYVSLSGPKRKENIYLASLY